jgi:hypothetical protein
VARLCRQKLNGRSSLFHSHRFFFSPRVTRLAEFSSFGRFFTLGSFSTTIKVTHIFVLHFR